MARPAELTFRGLFLGALITVVFTASNICLALKIGLTFASSIPAAVISMAFLRLLGKSSILENNMVQSQASAAGTLSCVFSTFPALILIGHWASFPWMMVAGLTAAGGIAGVLFTIPLRHALVKNSSLIYPEGVAAAEILRAGETTEGAESAVLRLKLLLRGAAISGGITFLSGGLRLFSDGFSYVFTAGQAVFRYTSSFSMALIGAGYLVGIAGGMAMLAGVAIAWGIAVPWMTATSSNLEHLAPLPLAMSIWSHQVRFIGAGAIAVASTWTLGELAKPVAQGIRAALASSKGGLSTDDSDLSPKVISIIAAISSAILFALFYVFLAPSTGYAIPLAFGGTVLFLLFGFLTASACGYMAGLVGSSSSPISGITLIANVLICVLLLGAEASGLLPASMSADHHHLAIAFTIILLSAITAASAISNDNLQDLKTGQLVGASPWKQEAVLIVGCLIGAAVIPPVLNLLYQAYGFPGAMPRPGMDPSHALSAPQPALVVMIADGMLNRTLDWSMLLLGCFLGGVLIIADRILRRFRMSLPPLAVGIGLYLPPDISVTLGIGAIIGWMLHRKHREGEAGPGMMIASGLIVGESLVGVGLAAVSGISGSDSALAVTGPGSETFTIIGGLIAFIAACWWFIRHAKPRQA